jgi:hypothetical protein
MIKTIFLISDLLFPLWLIGLIVILKKHGVSMWKAWGISSSFCLAQAYLVAKIVGWNLGGYFIAFVSSIPAMILGKDKVPDAVTSVLFWVLPPVVFVILPMLCLYLLSKGRGAS